LKFADIDYNWFMRVLPPVEEEIRRIIRDARFEGVPLGQRLCSVPALVASMIATVAVHSADFEIGIFPGSPCLNCIRSAYL
jgi:hypothetical protein